jgi:membrane protein
MDTNRKKHTNEEKGKPRRIILLRIKIRRLTKFLSYGIWRQNPQTLSNKQNILYYAIKTAILTVRNIKEQNIPASSRSLTYRTILSIVPLLAILFAIARGFGIENILESSVINFIIEREPVHTETPVPKSPAHPIDIAPNDSLLPDTTYISVEQLSIITTVTSDELSVSEKTRDFFSLLFHLIDNSLRGAEGRGIFAGVGILLFLYTIMVLFGDIENSFNRIWQVSKGRSLSRRLSDYFAFILLMPVLFVVANAISFITFPESRLLEAVHIFYPIFYRLLSIIPYVIIIGSLTFLYAFMPNTKVRFVNAFIAGLTAGTVFYFFQMIYLSGLLWIAHYNAIYGTFAAIPLMLLWIQTSWFIVLVGAEISYAAQNVGKFSFEKETRSISRRYKDFFTLMIASVIVQRFANDKPPLTADQISERCKSPARLTRNILNELQALKIISPTPSLTHDRVMAYLPALNIDHLSVNYLMSRLDKRGSEDFMIDMEGDFQEHWNALIDTRMRMYEGKDDILLKDL